MSKSSSHVLRRSEGFKRYRAWVAVEKVTVNPAQPKTWTYSTYGPKDSPAVVCLGGVSSTVDAFYRQMLTLAAGRGFRLVSAQWPPYWKHEDWVRGFERFLDQLGLHDVHIVGVSLGGYLAQCYAQIKPARVKSLFLVNTFSDMSYFVENAPFFRSMFPWTPLFVLQKMVLDNMAQGKLSVARSDAIDFMVKELDKLDHDSLASRLTLNCTPGPLIGKDFPLEGDAITLVECLDHSDIPTRVREELRKYHPTARVAELRTGGAFPHLATPDDFDLHLQVHLRRNGVQPSPNAK